MSELQIGLAIVGVLVVFAVALYNRWQERKLQRALERSLRTEHDDVLLASNPGRGKSSGRLIAVVDGTPSYGSPMQGEQAQLDQQNVKELIPEKMDIDFTIHIEFGCRKFGHEIINGAVRVLSTMPKSVQLIGLISDMEAWEPVRHDAEYTAVSVSLQLVDRRGCVTLRELFEFEGIGLQLASLLDAKPYRGNVDSAFDRAKSLDQFCTEVDIQVALHVVGMNVTVDQVKHNLEALNFSLEEDSRYRCRDRQGQVILSITLDVPSKVMADELKMLRVSKLSVELDVPRVPDDVENYLLQCTTATELAKSLGGSVVDDRQNAVSHAALELIGVEVRNVWDAMRKRGIPAGSPLALRLFS